MVQTRAAYEAQYIIRLKQVFKDLERMQKTFLHFSYSFGDVPFSVPAQPAVRPVEKKGEEYFHLQGILAFLVQAFPNFFFAN